MPNLGTDLAKLGPLGKEERRQGSVVYLGRGNGRERAEVNGGRTSLGK